MANITTGLGTCKTMNANHTVNWYLNDTHTIVTSITSYIIVAELHTILPICLRMPLIRYAYIGILRRLPILDILAFYDKSLLPVFRGGDGGGRRDRCRISRFRCDGSETTGLPAMSTRYDVPRYGIILLLSLSIVPDVVRLSPGGDRRYGRGVVADHDKLIYHHH